MDRNDGGPAFPLAFEDARHGPYACDGMSLRDYFAAHAPLPPDSWHGGDWKKGVSADSICEWRYYYADAMLTARSK